MKNEKLEQVGAITGVVAAFAAGFIWLGRLDNRIEQLEKLTQNQSATIERQSSDIELGPRGQNCQLIVGKLVERPGDKSLMRLAEEWQCSGFAAATGDAPLPVPDKGQELRAENLGVAL